MGYMLESGAQYTVRDQQSTDKIISLNRDRHKLKIKNLQSLALGLLHVFIL
jgi:hypothetical protein